MRKNFGGSTLPRKPNGLFRLLRLRKSVKLRSPSDASFHPEVRRKVGVAISIWGAHAPSRAHCGASPQCSRKRKVRDGGDAIASTRGACAPRVARHALKLFSPPENRLRF